MFDTPEPPGIAVVCGAVSGNKETIDFDHKAETIFQCWSALVQAEQPGLIERLCVVRTPRQPAAYHVNYRCPDVDLPGSTKLAQEPGTDPNTGKPCRLTLVETRGEGGYALAPGTPGACHSTGGTCEYHSRPRLEDLPAISVEEREILIRCARSFDFCIEASSKEPRGPADRGLTPGDDYDLRGPPFAEILAPLGWTLVREVGRVAYLRRPGKDGSGWSATAGYCRGPRGEDLLRVFSTNAHPFENGKSYGKFRAFALVNHGGNCKAAAKELSGLGFGDGESSRNGHVGHRRHHIDSAPEPARRAIVTCLETVQAQLVSWLWNGRIPRAALMILDGDPELGKSTIMLDVAARVTLGLPMPGESLAGDYGGRGVILLSAEDSLPQTIRPRLNAAAADCKRVFHLDAVTGARDEAPPVLPFDLDLVEREIKDRGAVLLIIDPVMAFLDGAINAHHDQEVRRALHPLKLLAERTGAAVAVVRHLNKMNAGPALYRGGGSIALIGAARVGLIVGRDPGDPARRVLAVNKNNLAPHRKSLVYNLVDAGCGVARVEWGEEVDLKADDILGQPASKGRCSAVEQCTSSVRELLASGSMPANEFDESLKGLGYEEHTIKAARKAAKVKSRADGFQGPRIVYLDSDEVEREGELFRP